MILNGTNKLEREISRGECEAISFDIFDTLLVRTIDPPAALKGSAAERAVRGLRLPVSAAQLLRLRREAEEELIGRSLAAGADGECSVAEVFQRLSRALGPEKASVEGLLACELEVEKAYSHPMPGIAALLGRLSRTHRLVAISDTYLPKELLIALLEQSGLARYFSEVYPSCQYGLSKGSGRLFQKVLALEGAAAEKWLHIGDNFLGDYFSPRRLGIQAILVRDKVNLRRRSRLAASHQMEGRSAYWCAASLAERQFGVPVACDTEEASFYRWGRTMVGPLLVNFLHLLCLELERSRPDAVFFIAREGYLLKKLYEVMARELLGALPAPPRYLCVSRYTAFLAALEGAGEREVAVSLSEFAVSLDAVLARFGISSRDRVQHLLERHGWQEENATSKVALRELLLRLLGDDDFLALAGERGRDMKDGLKGHLAELGFFSCERVALADVGWFGGIQDSLAELFTGIAAPKLHGYYLSLEGSGLYGSGQKSGLVHDFRNPSPEGASLGFFKLAFEFTCRALHGTTVGYRKLPGGRTVPLFREDGRERGTDAAIAIMQRGVFDCARDYLSLLKLHPVSPQELSAPLLKMYQKRISFPDAALVQAFSGVINSEDFGTTRVKQVAGNFGLSDIFTPRRTLIRFIETPWREAALQGTRIPGVLVVFSAVKRLLAGRKIARDRLLKNTGAGATGATGPTLPEVLSFKLALTAAAGRHLMTGLFVAALRPLPAGIAVWVIEALIKWKRLLLTRGGWRDSR